MRDQKPASAPGQAQPVVRGICDLCRRDGRLVCQSVLPKPANADPGKYPLDPTGPWVVRSYLCRYHRGARNRQRKLTQRRRREEGDGHGS